jgi:hypothetical protein
VGSYTYKALLNEVSYMHRSKFCRSRVALLCDTTELLRHKTREEGKNKIGLKRKKRKKRREKGKKKRKNKIGR